MVGRTRKGGNPLGLEKRVYWHHGQFIYRHRDGRAEQLGTDLAKANERARLYNDPGQRFGQLGYYIDLYIAEAHAGRLHRKLKPRTIADNEREAIRLKAVFDDSQPIDLVNDPSLIAEYRDTRSANEAGENGQVIRGAPVRANRELSLLSSVYAWLIEKGHVPGLTVNPVKSIARNRETPKERYVEDADYRAVYAIAQRSICMAMDTVYQSLQRPADVLGMGPDNQQTRTVAGAITKVLSVTQGKTGRTVNIESTAALEATLAMLTDPDSNVRMFSRYLVHTLKGKRYTVTGIGSMLRRCCNLAGVSTFGLMDLRAKGATDMYLRGVPLEMIQQLMGHASVTTTEIYIKRLLATVRIAAPNTAVAGE